MTVQLKWLIGYCVCGCIVFCTTFAVLFRAANKAPSAPSSTSAFSSSLLEKALPETNFTNQWGARLDDALLRHGKVVLVFIAPGCEACEYESQFLRTLVNTRKDMRFYGVIPIGQKQASLKAAENQYPFDVYYDDGQLYVHSSSAISVPTKVFIEEGIIKQTWEGASGDDAAKTSFSEWLASVK